ARGAVAQQSFSLTVAGGNHAPTLLGLQASYTLLEGTLLRIPVDAIDPDGQTLSLTMDRLPPGAIFDPVRRVFEWIPNFSQAGTYGDVRVIASDGALSTTASLQITVLPANAPPLIAGVAPRSVREGDPIRVAFSALDVDGDPLRWRSPNLPPGATLNPLTGVFEWTPAYNQAGPWKVSIWVDDGRSQAETVLDLSVANVNAPPVFDQLAGLTVVEGQAINFRAFAFDPDNPGFAIPDRLGDGTLTAYETTLPTVTYSVLDLPPGASFDPATAVFSWAPTFSDAGVRNVRFTATDDGDGTGLPLTTTITVPITVLNVNRAPVLPELNAVSANKGEVLEVDITATDPDGNPLVYSATGLPRFGELITAADGSAKLRFTPGNQDRGNSVITVSARDNGDGGGPAAALVASRTFVLSSLSAAEPPVLQYVGNKVALFGQPLEFTLLASDKDQDTLTFTAEGLPPSATLVPGVAYGTAKFSWTPTSTEGGVRTVKFTVTDSTGLSDTQTIQITARATNTAPLLAPVGNRTVAEGATLTLQLSATDADGDSLTYARPTNLPPGASFDAATGLLTWIPSFESAGVYQGIGLSVSDGAASSSETISITVTPTNRAPLMLPVLPVAGQERSQLQFNLLGVDPDSDVLIYKSTSPLPAGSTFDPATGLFKWTPSYDQAGTYALKFAVQDPSGAQSEQTITLNIADVNRSPVLSFTNHQVTLGETLKFKVDASDPDTAETLRFGSRNLPEGATLDPVTGEIIWTPTAGQLGDHVAVLSLSDGKTSVERALVLRVTALPVGPKVAFVLTPSFPAVPGQPVFINVVVDPFSAIAARTLTVNGAALALDSNGRAVFVAPASGLYALRATGTDLDGFTSVTTTVLRVRDPSDAAAPQVALAATLEGLSLTTAGAVEGLVNDRNLESWQLEIARAGTDGWRQLASGTANVDGALGTIDPASFEAGAYQLRLTAADVAGRSTMALRNVELRGGVSASRYTRTDTDFSFTLAGHTLDFQRRYDSLAIDRKGAFGEGWRLALRDVDLALDLPPSGRESGGAYPPLVAGTRLFLTTPTGERVGFTFTPERVREAGVTWYRAVWQADAGSAWRLESVQHKLQRAGDAFYLLDGSLPYNPAGLPPEGAQYTLSGTDGTRYEINAARGISGIVFSDGVRLLVNDTGIAAANGDRLTWVLGVGGRIESVTTPTGAVHRYSYDTAGRLEAARSLVSATSLRYGYDAQGRLRLATGPGAGVVVEAGVGATTVRPLAGDLGPALAYLSTEVNGQLGAGGSAEYALTVRDSELRSSASGSVLLGVEVKGNTGLAPTLPLLDGATLVASRIQGNTVFALFRVDAAGLKRLTIGAAGAGSYRLRLAAAGDLNGDQRVDGSDAALMAQARSGGSVAGADIDRDGDVDSADSLLLYAQLGFTPNQAPVVQAASFRTHVDLSTERSLASLLSDPENDSLSLRIVRSENGSATVTADGRTLLFKPLDGYFGPASVTVTADDGYSASAETTISFQVSNAALLAINFDQRVLKLRPGDQLPVTLTGTFADEADVVLPADYLNFSLVNPQLGTLTPSGVLTTRGEGHGVVVASRGNISAATVLNVGSPRSGSE
ncbi:MAG: putative Ig domain-containing protein, partial [Burkholderiales bacterium]